MQAGSHCKRSLTESTNRSLINSIHGDKKPTEELHCFQLVPDRLTVSRVPSRGAAGGTYWKQRILQDLSAWKCHFFLNLPRTTSRSTFFTKSPINIKTFKMRLPPIATLLQVTNRQTKTAPRMNLDAVLLKIIFSLELISHGPRRGWSNIRCILSKHTTCVAWLIRLPICSASF